MQIESIKLGITENNFDKNNPSNQNYKNAVENIKIKVTKMNVKH